MGCSSGDKNLYSIGVLLDAKLDNFLMTCPDKDDDSSEDENLFDESPEKLTSHKDENPFSFDGQSI